MSNDDRGRDDEALLKEAHDTLRRYLLVRREFMTWGTRIGPVRVRAVVGTNGIFVIFVAWHLLALVVGIIAVLAWTSARELGIALIVGSLFGVGSFISQVWSQGMDREREFIHKIEYEGSLDRLRAASQEMRDIERRINRYLHDGD